LRVVQLNLNEIPHQHRNPYVPIQAVRQLFAPADRGTGRRPRRGRSASVARSAVPRVRVLPAKAEVRIAAARVDGRSLRRASLDTTPTVGSRAFKVSPDPSACSAFAQETSDARCSLDSAAGRA
jgi:hypothetical protein